MPPDTDYTRNPPDRSERQRGEDDRKTLDLWVQRKNEAENDRKQYLSQVKVNRKFAAGKQHLDVNTRDGRVVDIRVRNGIKMVTSDILSQYLLTAVGRMAGQDYRPTFLTAQDNEIAEDIAKQMNVSFSWAWEHEILADKKILQLWRLLVIDGTCAVRCRYDRRFGEIVGDVPYRDGKPILDDKEARKYVAEEASEGRRAKIATLREGRIVWELLSIDNLLPPPGFDDPQDFPWEIVQRAVLLDDLKDRYKNTDDMEAEEMESSGSLTAGLGFGDEKNVKLQGRVMVYTGYVKPNSKDPHGRTVVFTNDRLLDDRDHLPYDSHPRGPSTGVHYFRWSIIPGRFLGKAFIENGIGPQQVRNKRLTQIDAIIDRNMPKVFIEEQSLARPKTGDPMEVVEVRPGAPLPKVEQGVPPGAWMLQDVRLQEENAERALGMRSITLGQPPAGVTAYSAMALLNENNSLQLDPISQEFRLSVIELAWDTMEAMRNWPPNKNIMLAGPEGTLQSFLFNSNQIPNRYLVHPPRGGALPRSQAAELQKVNDIWQASKGTPTALPLSWYIESLNQGKAQDLPPSLGDQQAHKAELENIAMVGSMQPAPVADYDDHAKHVEICRAFQVPIKAMADLGDEDAADKVQVLESHIREHLSAASAGAGGQTQPVDTIGMPQQGIRPPVQPGGLPNVPEAPALPNLPAPTGTG